MSSKAYYGDPVVSETDTCLSISSYTSLSTCQQAVFLMPSLMDQTLANYLSSVATTLVTPPAVATTAAPTTSTYAAATTKTAAAEACVACYLHTISPI